MPTVHQALYDGESYELCLTTALTAEQHVKALDLYRSLRRINPAPYAAWLSFSNELQVRALNSSDAWQHFHCLCWWTTPVLSMMQLIRHEQDVRMQVCCSSPERFLRGGRDRTVEAKPIKGTARRNLEDAVADAAAAKALEASEKVRHPQCVVCLSRRHKRMVIWSSIRLPSWLPCAHLMCRIERRT